MLEAHQMDHRLTRPNQDLILDYLKVCQMIKDKAKRGQLEY